MSDWVWLSHLQSHELDCVDWPVHVVHHPGVQLHEVLGRDHVVRVQIQHVVEKIGELVSLKVSQQFWKIGVYLYLYLVTPLSYLCPPPRLAARSRRRCTPGVWRCSTRARTTCWPACPRRPPPPARPGRCWSPRTRSTRYCEASQRSSPPRPRHTRTGPGSASELWSCEGSSLLSTLSWQFYVRDSWHKNSVWFQ